jgi:hypothetical protein
MRASEAFLGCRLELSSDREISSSQSQPGTQM